MNKMEAPGEKERKKVAQNLFKETRAENVPILGEIYILMFKKLIDHPKNFTPKQSSKRHIIIKPSKIKDKENF